MLSKYEVAQHLFNERLISYDDLVSVGNGVEDIYVEVFYKVINKIMKDKDERIKELEKTVLDTMTWIDQQNGEWDND